MKILRGHVKVDALSLHCHFMHQDDTEYAVQSALLMHEHEILHNGGAEYAADYAAACLHKVTY